MSPEKQRIAIAEACGWTLEEPDDFTGKNTSPQGQVYSQQIRYGFKSNMNHTDRFSGVPDYLKDLNAMHKVEKTLDTDQKNEYINILHHICWIEESENDLDLDFAWCSATSAQRAEAFLKTIGKWEDGSEP